MIMPREKREIQKEDIMPLDVYTKNRGELRKSIVDFKKNRRIALGPYATFYFESYETMLAQVQEMLYICLLYTSPSPRDISGSRMPSSA